MPTCGFSGQQIVQPGVEVLVRPSRTSELA